MAIGIPNINLDLSALANIPNRGGFGKFLTGDLPGPVLGPDDFGSYTIPMSDPTYRSGFDYARSIAGGMPMEQVIAPGVSYSPEQPMGYTQEQLNTPVGTTPVEPPQKLPGPGEEGYGQGIGGVRIFDEIFDRKRMPPPRDIFGGTRDIRDVPPLSGLMNIGKLFGGGIDKDAIDKIVQERIAESMPIIEQPDLSQFVRREDIPSLIPKVPTGREFSIEDIRGGLDLPDFTKFAKQEDIPSIPTFVQPDLTGFARLEDIPTFDPNVLKQDILMSIPQQQVPDVSQFATQEDIQKAIAGIDIPTYQAPDLSAYDLRLAELEQQLTGLQQPTGGRFSISQPAPRGLF